MAKDLPVINLMGPTASGKTALACQLYDQGHYEIISVDSALVYRDMDIGTAKPNKLEQQKYPHHLIDIIEPTQVYSAAEFVEDAEHLIDNIHARGKIPLLVGGTMLYFKSLLEGLADNLPSADAKIRTDIENMAEQQGWQYVYEELKRVDPKAGEKFKISDRQRIIRALEVYLLTGKPITQLQAEQSSRSNNKYHFVNYALLPDRAELHIRIERRLEQMWSIGFLDEVNDLIGKYNIDENLPSMRSVGYRQALEYLMHGDFSHKNEKEMQLKALYATRQLAKRQYTWLRSLQELHKFNTFHTLQEGEKYLRNLFR
ncbi:tRNA (adenosine(37)-N6)-dimethylallyltransferase MiaA [Acinetobacter qingfengensis]|uniref:tRNA dimethylallyltransferase n=1 Tax=Acinetobacter qingfengensis TaxID=1262585 RepID=A0A1E7R2N7_9GAMM|nr:tRNA (adenosine(37)-N6)-dimethylallyltransferase MiaA [Acinetobacter qingfengensis]KAA8735335.1 tRNA (adenosine(37)-N6)-dimethylallyltransferase MiaA [Acinetobacter qingfengensis]OEY93582.1 tRNA (adenosine(37)-N6)-dimethylallyltransferase MiaA [Acinetobacter qingfengensis]